MEEVLIEKKQSTVSSGCLLAVVGGLLCAVYPTIALAVAAVETLLRNSTTEIVYSIAET